MKYSNKQKFLGINKILLVLFLCFLITNSFSMTNTNSNDEIKNSRKIKKGTISYNDLPNKNNPINISDKLTNSNDEIRDSKKIKKQIKEETIQYKDLPNKNKLNKSNKVKKQKLKISRKKNLNKRVYKKTKKISKNKTNKGKNFPSAHNRLLKKIVRSNKKLFKYSKKQKLFKLPDTFTSKLENEFLNDDSNFDFLSSEDDAPPKTPSDKLPSASSVAGVAKEMGKQISCKTKGLTKICSMLKMSFPKLHTSFSAVKNGVNQVALKIKSYKFTDFLTVFPQSVQLLAKKIGLQKIKFSNIELKIAFGKLKGASLKTDVDLFGLKFSGDVMGILAKKPAFVLGLEAKFSLVLNLMEKVSLGKLPAKSNPLAMFGDSSLTFMLHFNEIDFHDIEFLKPKYYDEMVKGENTKKPFIKIMSKVSITDTSKHPAAAFLKKFVLTSEYIFTLTFTTKMVKVTVAANEIALPGGLKITGAGLYLYVKYKSPQDFDFGIKGDLVIPMGPKQLITLGGRLILSPTAGGFEFTMKGILSNPFFIPRIHFGDLRVKAKFGYESGIPSNIEFEGTIALGTKCFKGNTFIGNGYCLKASGGVGLNTRDPSGNYFFVKVTGMTFDILLTAIAGSKSKKVRTPPIFNDNFQFPKGMFVSFSGAEKTIGNITLPVGLKIKGVISAFKKPTTIDITVDINKKTAKADIIFHKSFIFKGITFGRSMGEKQKGPIFRGTIKNNKLKGQMIFYLGLKKLKFYAEVKAKMDKKGMQMHLKGSLFGKFAAEFDFVMAKKNGKTSISMNGQIDLGSFLNKLISKVEKSVGMLLRFPKIKLPKLKLPKLKLPKIRFIQVDEKEFMKNRESFIEKYGNVKTNFEAWKSYSVMKTKKKPLFTVQKTSFNAKISDKGVNFQVTFYCTLLGKKKILKIIYDPFNPSKTMMSFVKAVIKVMFK